MSPTDPPVAYERRIVSVLFADLVGFTSLGELLDPEDVAAIQDRYFAAVRQAVERYGGRLEKFIGDAAMAAFGVPRTLDDDAERAVRCGLAIVAAVERLDAELDLEPGAIAVRVGVATGEVVHAEAGPDAGRVTGDTVNLAARLQTAAPPAGVLISEPTALAVEEVVELGPALSLELKGKADRVRARTALGTRAIRSREIAMGDLRAATLGREDELRELLGGLEHVRREQKTERWLVMAPPGTGKTRLLEELARRRPEAVTVRRARFRSDDPRPFGALAELASSVTGRGPAGRSLEGPDLVGRLRAAGLAHGRAAVVAAALGELAGANLADAAGAGSDAGPASAGQAEGPAGPAGAGPAKVGPDGPTGRTAAETAGVDRDARFEAWIDGIDALAEGGGELWIVEDAHWAGGDALAFLDAIGRRPVPGGRLLVVSARPSLLEREPDWCAAGPGVGRNRPRWAHGGIVRGTRPRPRRRRHPRRACRAGRDRL